MEFSELKKVNEEMIRSEIATDNGKKKMYAEVPQRVQAFRKLFPNGSIVTELLQDTNGVAIIKATVSDETGKVLSTGIAFEERTANFINQTSYIENCETSAVGRALGFLGIGSETSIASKEEVENAINAQKSAPAPTHTGSATDLFDFTGGGNIKKASDKQIAYLVKLLDEKQISKAKVAAQNRVKDLSELSSEVCSNLIKQLQAS